MPVLSIARQRGSSSGLGAVTKVTPLRTVLRHPIPTPLCQPGRPRAVLLHHAGFRPTSSCHPRAIGSRPTCLTLVRVRVTGSGPTKGMPVWSAARRCHKGNAARAWLSKRWQRQVRPMQHPGVPPLPPPAPALLRCAPSCTASWEELAACTCVWIHVQIQAKKCHMAK
eukprot:365806-Chlamydomonas_euryale.AAC.6